MNTNCEPMAHENIYYALKHILKQRSTKATRPLHPARSCRLKGCLWHDRTLRSKT